MILSRGLISWDDSQGILFEKLHNHGARVESGGPAAVVLIVRVGNGGGPVVVDVVAVVHERDEPGVGAGPVPVQLGGAVDDLGQGRGAGQAVARRPVGHVRPHVGQAAALAQAAVDGDGRVVAPVEVEQRDVAAARAARLDEVPGDVVARRQRRRRARRVEGARDGGEGRDALRGAGVARQDPDEAAALGFPRGVDAARVDAQLVFHVVQDLAHVVYVVGRRVGRPLPVDVALGRAILQSLRVDDDVVLVKVRIRQSVQVGLPVGRPACAVEGEYQRGLLGLVVLCRQKVHISPIGARQRHVVSRA